MNKFFSVLLGVFLGIAAWVVVAVISWVVKDWGNWDALLGAFRHIATAGLGIATAGLGIVMAVVLFSGLWVIFILGVKLVSSVGKRAGRKEMAEKAAEKKEEWWEL